MSYKLIHGDCLEVMPTLESVDAVITDPPYGINENSKKVASRGVLALPQDYGYFDWDTQRISKNAVNLILNISKNQIIFGGNYYTDMLKPSPSWIIWDKVNGANDFADCEMAWTSHNKAVRKFTYMWHGMIKQKPEERFHPTQKPLDLMIWCVSNYTNPGDTILDPFMGSGTTGVACMRTGRNFIGIEINAEYFAIAQRRIEEATYQPSLFAPQPTQWEPVAMFGDD